MRFLLLLSLVSCLPEKGPLTYSVNGIVENAEATEAVTFKEVQEKILAPKCLDCHGWVLNETRVLSKIVPGRPEASKLFRVVENGSMPKDAPPLTTQELELLRGYINSLLAPEN